MPLPRNKEFTGRLTTNKKNGKRKSQAGFGLTQRRWTMCSWVNWHGWGNYNLLHKGSWLSSLLGIREASLWATSPWSLQERFSFSTIPPLRIVFDGKAAEPGTNSLNDFFHVGPILLPRMQNIICRFRTSQCVCQWWNQESLHASRATCGRFGLPYVQMAQEELPWHIGYIMVKIAQPPLGANMFPNCFERSN